MHAVIVEACVIEIAPYRISAGMLHREPVLRLVPEICFGLMATGASFAADKVVAGLAGARG